MSLLRKRRTREHVIADLSVNFVERQVLLCGHTAERVFHDYGYDLFVFTFDAYGQPEPGEVRVQVKASDNLLVDSTKDVIPLRVARSNLIQWLEERLPVILVLYDAQKESAYWVDVKTYFRQFSDFSLFTIGKTITINIPRSNSFEQDAVHHMVRLKNRVREAKLNENL